MEPRDGKRRPGWFFSASRRRLTVRLSLPHGYEFLAVAALAGLTVLLALGPHRLAHVGEIRLSFASMIHFDAFRTFSGLLTLLAMLALLSRRLTPAALLLIIDGAAGTGIFWDRWSRATGHQVQLSALFSGALSRTSDLDLLVTHLPLLIIGLAIIATVSWRNAKRHGLEEET
jgi:hypothetical protein